MRTQNILPFARFKIILYIAIGKYLVGIYRYGAIVESHAAAGPHLSLNFAERKKREVESRAPYKKSES